MKIKNQIKKKWLGISLFIGVLMNSCGDREATVNCFPERPINVQLNLNLPAYALDLETKGWFYINEQQSGTRGLILRREGVFPNYRFLVFDRNAPHLCPDTNTTLEVQGNVKIVCPQDGAEWLLNGTPVKGSSLPPKNYYSSYNPTTGIIMIQYN